MVQRSTPVPVTNDRCSFPFAINVTHFCSRWKVDLGKMTYTRKDIADIIHHTKCGLSSRKSSLPKHSTFFGGKVTPWLCYSDIGFCYNYKKQNGCTQCNAWWSKILLGCMAENLKLLPWLARHAYTRVKMKLQIMLDSWFIFWPVNYQYQNG